MFRRLMRRGLVAGAELALRLLPVRNHVVVTGWPRDEGNAVELARDLLAARIPMVWLDPPSDARLDSLGFPAGADFRRVPKRSLRGFVAFATARCVFFTHGVYGRPRPMPGKGMVNLWHGDGPKMEGHSGERGRPPVPAHHLVGVSKIFADYRASALGTPPDGVLLFGLPRQRQLRMSPSPDQMRLLGIDPSRPFVLWMPTYRTSTGSGLVSGWTDGDASFDLESVFRERVGTLIEAGVQMAVKKHPLDAINFEIEGLIDVTDVAIADAGMSLYQLVGASAGLLTDYSSIWVEYLELDRPIAFLAPDEEEYVASRGLFPADVMTNLPGAKLTDESTCTSFAAEVLDQTNETRTMRAVARDRFGIVPAYTAVSRLIEYLQDDGVLPSDVAIEPRESTKGASTN